MTAADITLLRILFGPRLPLFSPEVRRTINLLVFNRIQFLDTTPSRYLPTLVGGDCGHEKTLVNLHSWGKARTGGSPADHFPSESGHNFT